MGDREARERSLAISKQRRLGLEVVVAQLVGDAAGARDRLELSGERGIGEQKRFELLGVRGVERAEI